MATNVKILSAVAEDDDILLLSSYVDDSEPLRTKLAFNKLNNYQYRHMFRFDKTDISPLRTALGIPEKVVCQNRTAIPGDEGLCVLLRRLAYPNRLDDLVPIFGRTKSELSYIFNTVLNTVYENHRYRLSDLDQPWLDEPHLQEFAAAIADRGAPLDKCWGFIDGTVRSICRPGENQRLVFSGHKRVHGIKFQSITTPSGMIANLYGPIEGCRHDSGILRMSGVLNQLEQHMTGRDGSIYSLYGDQAYPLSQFLIPPFKGAAIPPDQSLFNKRMSALRISVEWTFGKLLSQFAFVDYRKNQKLYLQPVGKYYVVAAILTNCHSCLYGSETAEFFGVDAPTLQEYLAI